MGPKYNSPKFGKSLVVNEITFIHLNPYVLNELSLSLIHIFMYVLM